MSAIERLVAQSAFIFCAAFLPLTAQAQNSPFNEQQFEQYENTASSLTAVDIQYLKDNQLILPDGLSPAQNAGLDSVINDPRLQNDSTTRRQWVDYYLNLAAAQNMGCMFAPTNPAMHCELSSYHQ